MYKYTLLIKELKMHKRKCHYVAENGIGYTLTSVSGNIAIVKQFVSD